MIQEHKGTRVHGYTGTRAQEYNGRTEQGYMSARVQKTTSLPTRSGDSRTPLAVMAVGISRFQHHWLSVAVRINCSVMQRRGWKTDVCHQQLHIISQRRRCLLPVLLVQQRVSLFKQPLMLVRCCRTVAAATTSRKRV